MLNRAAFTFSVALGKAQLRKPKSSGEISTQKKNSDTSLLVNFLTSI